jgi:hypothetical protein
VRPPISPKPRPRTDHLLEISPVLPSQDIPRDVAWYEAFVGFRVLHQDDKYAVLKRERFCLHLQWHADTADDPLLGGSVIKLFVRDIMPLFEEFVARETITPNRLRRETPWRTHEFGFYNLNGNAIFVVQDL